MKSEILIHTDELDRQWIDRMADLGVKVLGLHPEGGSGAADSLKHLLQRLETPSYRALLDYAAERGLEIEYEMHAASYLLPRELFATNPEYFRMDEDGNRTPDFNFCVSNPQALDLVAANAATLARSLYRSRPYYYFWMDDKRKKICHCPKCRNLSTAEQQLTVVNRMLAEIQKSIPNAKMAHIAYLDCLDVPRQVEPARGVFLEFAPFEKHLPHPDGDFSRVEEEKRMMPFLLDRFGRQDAKVLEYWLDNSLFSGWKKPPLRLEAKAEQIKADVVDYRRAGFDYIATFGCFLGSDYIDLWGEPDITPFTVAVGDD